MTKEERIEAFDKKASEAIGLDDLYFLGDDAIYLSSNIIKQVDIDNVIKFLTEAKVIMEASE